MIDILKHDRTAIKPTRLSDFSKSMGLSVLSLKNYGVGWNLFRKSWSFPMYDGTFKRGKPVVCGIHLREPSGAKRAIVGSRNGLFLPQDYDDAPLPDGLCDGKEPLLLLTPEGVSDCCAAMDMGFRAVGRPSNSSGAPQLRELLGRDGGSKQDVVIVADRDATKYRDDGEPFWPGIEGAIHVAHALIDVCHTLRFMLPPIEYKDLRAWLKESRRTEWLVEISRAPIVNHVWIGSAKARLIERRKSERISRH
jgi:hypothetical protein